MNIGNHGTDIPSAIGCFGRCWVLDGFEVGVYRWVEIHGISFIKRVDLAPRRNLNLRRVVRVDAGKDKRDTRQDG